MTRQLDNALECNVVSALFDFLGFITTRPGITAVGASQHVGPALDLLKEFCTQRGLNIDNAKVKDWHKLLDFKKSPKIDEPGLDKTNAIP